jgi:hypothetical protein
MALVYVHKRVKDNSIFYIGIGANLERAYEYKGRNQRWYDVVHSEPYYVHIFWDNITIEFAEWIEWRGIIKHGRIGFEPDGKLVNIYKRKHVDLPNDSHCDIKINGDEDDKNIIKSGKYKGKTVEEISKIDISYLMWVKEHNIFNNKVINEINKYI